MFRIVKYCLLICVRYSKASLNSILIVQFEMIYISFVIFFHKMYMQIPVNKCPFLTVNGDAIDKNYVFYLSIPLVQLVRDLRLIINSKLSFDEHSLRTVKKNSHLIKFHFQKF